MNNNTPNTRQNFPEAPLRAGNFPNGTSIVYYVMIALCIVAVSVLPLVVIDISVTAPGIVRPATERAEVKTITGAVITRLLFKSGDTIKKDSTLLMLQDPALEDRLNLLNTELREKYRLVNDLKMLTRASSVAGLHAVRKVVTPEYRKQLAGFLYQRIEKQATLKKLNHELTVNKYLFNEQVIAKNDLFNKEIELEQASAAFHSFVDQQLAVWHQLLSDALLKIRKLETEKIQLLREQTIYRIKAPVSGVIQMIMPVYEGSILQPGDVICLISPETNLIAECYVETKDVTFLKTCRKVSFQLDAFPYSYFGLITGTILSIENDFSLMNNRPVFKVFCAFDKHHMSLGNGYTVHLKKGMTLHARFLITQRTAWQLLFDSMNDWFNPAINTRR